MITKALKEMFKKIFPDKANEIDAIPEETAVQKPEVKPEVSTQKSEIQQELKDTLATIQAENKKLLDELAAFKKKEEDRDKLLTDKAAADKKQKIEDAIKKAIEDKKIPAKDEATIARYTKLYELDFDNTAEVVKSLPVIAGEKPGSQKSDVKTGIEVKGPFGSVDKTILKAVNEMSAASQN